MLGAGAVSPRTILCRVHKRPRVHHLPYLRSALAAAFLASVAVPAIPSALRWRCAGPGGCRSASAATATS